MVSNINAIPFCQIVIYWQLESSRSLNAHLSNTVSILKMDVEYTTELSFAMVFDVFSIVRMGKVRSKFNCYR